MRTYVTLDGRPGVWFFSLDCASSLAVIGARIGINLPYYRASMEMTRDGEVVAYRSERWGMAGPPAAFVGTYQPIGESFNPAPGRSSTSCRALLSVFGCRKTDLAGRHLSPELELAKCRSAHRAQLDDCRRGHPPARTRAVAPLFIVSGRSFLVAGARTLNCETSPRTAGHAGSAPEAVLLPWRRESWRLHQWHRTIRTGTAQRRLSARRRSGPFRSMTREGRSRTSSSDSAPNRPRPRRRGSDAGRGRSGRAWTRIATTMTAATARRTAATASPNREP